MYVIMTKDTAVTSFIGFEIVENRYEAYRTALQGAKIFNTTHDLDLLLKTASTKYPKLTFEIQEIVLQDFKL